MKFMATWSVIPGKNEAVIRKFQEESEPMEGYTQLGRWNEVGTGRGFRLIEADDLVGVTKGILHWQDLLDIKLVPVIDDDETVKALGG